MNEDNFNALFCKIWLNSYFKTPQIVEDYE